MLHIQRVLLDELAARFHHVAHQLGKDVIGLGQIIDLHLQQRPRLGVEGGFPQLFGTRLRLIRLKPLIQSKEACHKITSFSPSIT